MEDAIAAAYAQATIARAAADANPTVTLWLMGEGSSLAIAPHRGATSVPAFDRGWLAPDGGREPFIVSVDEDPSVNWSDDLEQLHEESTRTHFIDQWTRGAIVGGLGTLTVEPVIVDVGCSTGHLLEDLSRLLPDAMLIGVDLVASGLAKAHRATPTARLLHADACALPLADATVDAIVSANLLEHVPDDAAALREMARVLRPGARAAIVVPAGPSTYDYYDRFLGHERRYARGELAAKARAAGMEVIEERAIAALLYPPFWLVKQRNRRRYGQLEGVALQARVASDIARTKDSRVGRALWRAEEGLRRLRVSLPCGIRWLVVARRPPQGRS
ncbi:MAG: class I SAM-dependent methyltransferase [Solirubrobacteraceae bacterium]